MSLIDQILTNKPRETSGSKTSRKYTFQKDLSLFLLIEMHEKSNNYAILFDFHDDLIILDSDINPENIDFYQIKSNDRSTWTINSLIIREKDKLSILGRLYFNKLSFPDNTRSLNFISNSSFKFERLKDGSDSKSKSKITGIEMNDIDITLCNSRIKEEHSLNKNPVFENITTFHVSSLSNKDSSSHCIGALSKLLNNLNPMNKVNSVLAYNQIFNEINKKTNFDVAEVKFSELKDLIELKGITKNQFDEIIKSAGLYKSTEEEWNDLKSTLEYLRVGYAEILKYRNAWRNMTATVIKERDNEPLLKIINQIDDLVDITLKDISMNGLSIVQLAERISMNFENTIFDEYFIKCLIIRRLNEA
jgi:hypothetical protein